jgi:hypothetical protein
LNGEKAAQNKEYPQHKQADKQPFYALTGHGYSTSPPVVCHNARQSTT